MITRAGTISSVPVRCDVSDLSSAPSYSSAVASTVMASSTRSRYEPVTATRSGRMWATASSASPASTNGSR